MRTLLVVVLLFAAASCTPNSTEGSTLTSSVTTQTAPPTTTTTTVVDGPPGVDLGLFEQGLIPAERGIVGEMIETAPFYDLALVIGEDLDEISGSESVRYTNQEDTELDEVVFRLYPNIADGSTTVSNVTVDGRPVTPSYELDDSVMRIPLEHPLSPGERVDISMDIEIAVPTEEGGNYGTFLLSDDILAAAHFYPILAVYDDEGWNYEIPSPNGDVVYSDAGFYRVTIEAPDTLPIVTSGHLTGKDAPDSAGIGTRTFVAGPVRDLYLAASNRFSLVQTRIGDTVINAYGPPEFAVGNARVSELARNALAEFNSVYGPYPYTELDLVSTGTLALGVEYPGAIALNMGMYDPADEFDEGTISSTVVHEVAHQWFYGLVGNDQLDEPWLDEALAQYATWVYWRDTQGPGADEAFRSYLDSRWARVDHADIPIGLPVASYEGSEYGAIIYGRGPLFVDDLAGVMGDEVLADFLEDYVSRLKYGVSTTDEFRSIAEEHCECDLSVPFETAVYPRS